MSTRIIVRAPNHLGDCVMALPMINEVREAHPGSNVSLLVPENLATLYDGNLSLDKVIGLPVGHVHGWLAVFKIRDLIGPGNYDLGYILPPSFGAASGFKLAGVKERIGYIADGRRLLLTRPLPLPEPLNSAHRSETYFNMLRRGSGVELDFARPKLFLSDADHEEAATLLARFDVTAEDHYVVISYRAVAESRRWGIDKYTELAKRMVIESRVKVILVGTGGDQREGDVIAAAAGSGEVVNLAGKTSLRQLASLMARSEIFVGNDSGPAHLAAAVGARLVVLSGADDPRETSPMSPRKKLLYRTDLDCISCVKNVCPLKNDDFMACMKGISVDQVVAAISDATAE